MSMNPVSLLSLPGATFIEGFTGCTRPLSDFNTATLLSAYRADPATGTLLGPSIREEEDQEPLVTVGPVDTKTAEGFRDCLAGLRSQAQRDEMGRIDRSGRFVMDPGAVHPLASTTNGQWTWTFDIYGRVFFKGTVGRVVEINQYSDHVGTTIGANVGFSCGDSEAILGLAFYSEPRAELVVSTSVYHFYFRDSALAGLKFILGLEKRADTQEVMASLRNHLYESGQYTSEELSKTKEPFVIVKGDREALSIRLEPPDRISRSKSPRFFPLTPSLRKLLWRRAMASIVAA